MLLQNLLRLCWKKLVVMKAALVLLALCFSSQSAGAESLGKLTIAGNIVTFIASEKSHPLPDCVVESQQALWSADLSTRRGRAIYAVLLTALSANQTLKVTSAGNCADSAGIEKAQTVSIVIAK